MRSRTVRLHSRGKFLGTTGAAVASAVTDADRWGVLTAAAAARGAPLPVIDGLLVATALQHNLTLVTRVTGG